MEEKENHSFGIFCKICGNVLRDTDRARLQTRIATHFLLRKKHDTAKWPEEIIWLATNWRLSQ